MNWQEEKRRHLAKVRRVVVKVGSAVLASKEGLDHSRVEHLAAQICTLHDRGLDVVLVTSGAVAAGRGVLRKRCEIAGLPDKQAAAAVGQSRLMHVYDLAFAARDKVSAQVLLTREDLRSRQRFLNARNTFAALLSWRAIPVVNENDTVAVQELKFGDNDCLAGLLLNLTEADLFVNLTSASGVLDSDPDKNPDAKLLTHIDNVQALKLNELCGAKTSLGSGGMHSKMLAAQRAAQLGVPTSIVPGREPGILIRVLDGEDVGTWVRASGKSVSRRKFWLAYNAEPSGTLVIDAGAAKAVVSGGKSLLPAGIAKVEGGFGQGALVRIANAGGDVLAVGLCNYSAAELKRVLGKSLAGRAAEGEEKAYAEAVHRDNMLLHAAV